MTRDREPPVAEQDVAREPEKNEYGHPVGRERLAPGRWSRIDGQMRVQARMRASGSLDPARAAEQAGAGVAGGGGRLPYEETVQRLFGWHDVSRIRAHDGDAARAAAVAMGAEAFATGDDVAFAGAPSLHTVAHEAAHVVQQRAGVHLQRGVGQAGDEHERHADAVADAVVAGRSAEPLLDAYAGGGAARAVQRKLLGPDGEIPFEQAKLLVEAFLKSDFVAILEKEDRYTTEGVGAFLDRIVNGSVDVKIDLTDGIASPANQKAILAAMHAHVQQYRGEDDPVKIAGFATPNDNLVVGNHFFASMIGDMILADLSAGKAAALEFVGVTAPELAVDQFEWGYFEIVGTKVFFLVRSSVGEVSLAGRFSPAEGVLLRAHTHPALRVTAKEKNGDQVTNVSASPIDENFKRDKVAEKEFEHLKKVKPLKGFPLVDALNGMVSEKIVGGSSSNVWRILPSDADFEFMREGEHVFTPYRYDPETGLAHTFDEEHAHLPTLVWETTETSIFKEAKIEGAKPWRKVGLRLFASDNSETTLWKTVVYSKRKALPGIKCGQCVFDPAFVDD